MLTQTLSVDHAVKLASVFNTMRVLKKVNPGDTYYEAYLGHLAKSGPEFYDVYLLLRELAAVDPPRRILEIGTRTGISLCQLLSGYIDLSVVERIVCIDPFDKWTSPGLVRANLKYLNLDVLSKLEIFEKKSEEVLPGLSGTFAFALVDGDHTKAVAAQDLEGAHRLLEPGGVLVMDDVSDAPGECALIDVWEAFKKAHEAEYTWNLNMTGKGVAWAHKR